MASTLLNMLQKRVWGDLINVYKYPMGGSEDDRLFSAVSNGHKRANGPKLKYKKFHLKQTKLFRARSVVK